jgi:hypothetical protein
MMAAVGVAAVAALLAVDLTAVGAADPVAGQPLGAFGAAADGGHPSLGASRLSALSSTTVR